jgi:hypothetical protein
MSTGFTTKWIDEGHQIMLVTWPSLASGETGVAFFDVPKLAAFSDRSVQISGTLGGGTVTIEGANSVAGTTFNTLNDPALNALTSLGATLKQILECSVQIRPRVTGGDGTTAISVGLLVIGKGSK